MRAAVLCVVAVLFGTVAVNSASGGGGGGCKPINTVGMMRYAAIQTLKAHGCTFLNVYSKCADGKSFGKVLMQSPSDGAPVSAQTLVKLWVGIRPDGASCSSFGEPPPQTPKSGSYSVTFTVTASGNKVVLPGAKFGPIQIDVRGSVISGAISGMLHDRQASGSASLIPGVTCRYHITVSSSGISGNASCDQGISGTLSTSTP